MIEPLSGEDIVRLVDWHFVQENFRGYRLVGRHGITGAPHITTEVVDFDAPAMMALTKSFRVYHLIGKPNVDVAAELVHVHIRRWGLRVEDVALAELDDHLKLVLPRNSPVRH